MSSRPGRARYGRCARRDSGHPGLRRGASVRRRRPVRPATRRELSLLESLPVAASGGQTVPLSQVADLEEETGPAQVSREDLERRVTVQVNVRGRDIASFVADAQRRVEREVPLQPRYRLEWGGQFEHLQAATERLTLVIPLALLLIFVLLYTSFGAARPAAIIFLNVPFAVTGGVAALAVRGMPLSISAGVGFIALFGVAVLNGLVLVSTARHHEDEGATATEAVKRAAVERLRPVLMTALVAALGFLPMALSRLRRRGPTPARDGRHRRHPLVDAAHALRAPGGLQLVRGPQAALDSKRERHCRHRGHATGRSDMSNAATRFEVRVQHLDCENEAAKIEAALAVAKASSRFELSRRRARSL